MLITDQDQPIDAKEALELSKLNADDSESRLQFRETMEGIKYKASFGKTRYSRFGMRDKWSKSLVDQFTRMWYTVVETIAPATAHNPALYHYDVIFATCTCGAKATGSPGHAHHCDILTA